MFLVPSGPLGPKAAAVSLNGGFRFLAVREAGQCSGNELCVRDPSTGIGCSFLHRFGRRQEKRSDVNVEVIVPRERTVVKVRELSGRDGTIQLLARMGD